MRRVAGLLSVGVAICWAGADFGIRTKHTAKLTISRPPDELLRGRTITIRGREGVAFPNRQAVELAIERALSAEYTASKDGRDLVLTVAVAGYEPVTANVERVTENRFVKVGKKMQKSLFSDKMVEVDDIQQRAVPVEYWQARGALSLQVSVSDASGAVIDTVTPKGQYFRKIEISVQGVSTRKEELPTPQEIEAGLIETVAGELQHRYTKTRATLDVRLTVDDPLRPGNVLAMSGQWKEALDAWSSAQMKKNPGDRSYNMAVAYEALGYAAYDASQNPMDAAESFQRAAQLYDEALRSDPGEKFFKQAMDRCAQMKSNFERAKVQYDARERTARLQLAVAERREQAEEEKRQKQQEREQYLNSERADTKDEIQFRGMVRGQLSSLRGGVDQATQERLLQLGKAAYNLDELPALRVVHQEGQRLAKVRVNMDLYKTTFASLLGPDKVVTAQERHSLTDLAARLDLGADDVRAVESGFQFKDLSAARPAPSSPAPAPRAARPASPAAKPAASVVRPPASPKPTTPPASVITK